MKDIIQRINSAYEVAVIFFLFSGSLYFIYYSLESSKPSYILLSIIVYIVGFFIRHIVLKTKDQNRYTEPGILFISFLFTAYLLYVLEIDTNIKNYLPAKLLLQSGVAFIFIFLISLMSSLKRELGKIISILLLVTVLIIIQLNQIFIDNLFLNNPRLADLIIGFPVVYLITIVFGLHKVMARVGNSSQRHSR